MRPLPIAALMGASMLSGCGHSPEPTFLVLDQAPPTSPRAAYAGPPLRVPSLHLPVTLDRPELVRQDAAGTVRVDDFARWSAPLGLMARNTLILDLTERLPSGAVLPPDAPASAREIRVEATVLAFDVSAGDAVMTASYRLVPPGTDPRSTLVQLRTPIGKDEPADRARAWSSLIGQFGDRIVAALPER